MPYRSLNPKEKSICKEKKINSSHFCIKKVTHNSFHFIKICVCFFFYCFRNVFSLSKILIFIILFYFSFYSFDCCNTASKAMFLFSHFFLPFHSFWFITINISFVVCHPNLLLKQKFIICLHLKLCLFAAGWFCFLLK